MAIRFNAEDFWQFSLAFYCRESVANACLSLQDRRGADVNLLLVICWLARSGYVMTDAAIVHALTATATWSETILWPLRTVRRELAGFSDVAVEDRQSIKHALLSIELQAERISQQKIVASLELLIGGLSAEPARKLAAIGLDLYAMKLHAFELQDKADFDAILNALLNAL